MRITVILNTFFAIVTLRRDYFILNPIICIMVVFPFQDYDLLCKIFKSDVYFVSNRRKFIQAGVKIGRSFSLDANAN